MRSAAVANGVLGPTDGMTVWMSQVPALTFVNQTSDQDAVHELGVLAVLSSSATDAPSANLRSETRPIRTVTAPDISDC